MRRLLLIGLSFGFLVGACLSYLLLTQSGLRLVYPAFLPDSVELGAVYGRVLGPVRVEELRFDQPGYVVRAEQIDLDWNLLSALRGNVVIEILGLDTVEIELEGAESRSIDIPSGAGAVTVTMPYSIDLAFDWELDDPTAGTAQGTGRVAGNLAALDATLAATSPFAWQAAGTITDLIGAADWEATIEIPEFGIEGTPIQVELGGNVTWAPNVTYAIVGQWRSIAWTFTGLAQTQSPEGRFDIAGSLSSYRGSLSGRLRVPDNLALDPEGSIDTIFSGGTSNVRFNNIEIGTGGGEISGTASVDWSNGPRFDAQLRAEQFDPGLFFAGIAGEIDFDLIIEAAGSGGTPDYRLQLEPLSGIVNDYAVSGRASLQPDADGNALAEIDLRSGESTLSGSGLIGPMLDIAWQVDARDLSAFATQLSGALRSQGRVSGNRGSPRVEVTATGTDIGLGELRVGALNTQIDFDAGTGIIRESQTELRDFRWRELTFERVAAAAEGSAERHIINADLTASDGVTGIRAAGGYRDRRWSGELSRMETNLFGGWGLEAPTALEFADGELAPAEVCLLGNPGRFCASGSWITGSAWNVESDLEGADLTSFELFLPEAYEFSGSVSAAFRGRSGANGAWQGIANIDVGDVAVTTRGTGVALLTDGSGNAALDLDNRALSLDFELNSQQGELEARVNAGSERSRRRARR